MELVYFDNSATTKPHREVVNEVVDCMENYFGNPSSAHRLGVDAEKKIKIARDRVARLIGASPQDIIFTSGGSEANNTVLRGMLAPGCHIITSSIEHASVINALKEIEKEGCSVTYLSVDNRGIIDIGELENSIRENTRLVSIMHVNNEIGSIQPIEDIIKLIRSRNRRAKIHVDAVQSAGKLSIDVKRLDVDFLSLSAHKIHGPKGAGALYIKRGINLRPLIMGGGQENDLRSGTENLPGISGFGVAAEMAATGMRERQNHIYDIKSHFLEGLKSIDRIVINSPQDKYHIDNILNVSFEGVRGEVLLHALEDYRIYVSTGSACSAKKSAHKNYVLPSIGLKECQVEGAIRFSFSSMNTMEEVDYTVEALKKSLSFLRRLNK